MCFSLKCDWWRLILTVIYSLTTYKTMWQIICIISIGLYSLSNFCLAKIFRKKMHQYIRFVLEEYIFRFMARQISHDIYHRRRLSVFDITTIVVLWYSVCRRVKYDSTCIGSLNLRTTALTRIRQIREICKLDISQRKWKVLPDSIFVMDKWFSDDVIVQYNDIHPILYWHFAMCMTKNAFFFSFQNGVFRKLKI